MNYLYIHNLQKFVFFTVNFSYLVIAVFLFISNSWYIYYLVTQNMLRTHEEIRFVTALDLIKYPKQIK